MVDKNVLVIDIGSTKICAIIAQISDGKAKIIGSGICKSQGIKKGLIINIDLTSKAIKMAVADAKRISGVEIKKATVSISGAYTKSSGSSGVVNIPNKEITTKEINRVMHSSLYNASIPTEYQVLHTLPFNFIVDDQEYIEDPLGMNASRLEVETHIITTQKTNFNNLKKSVRAAGVEVESVVLAGYASAIAVLNDDERELGAAVVDMGGHTCNCVIRSGHSIRYNDFIGVGSNHITNDLSQALHTPLNIAEMVKCDHGSLFEPDEELIELPIINEENSSQKVSLNIVHNVLYARVEETLMILSKSIEKSGLKAQLGAGIVLTGGYTKLNGLKELASTIFDNMQIRIAKPTEIEGISDALKDPIYSTAIGLVEYCSKGYSPYEIDANRQMRYHFETSENVADIDNSTQSLPDEKPQLKPLKDEELPKARIKKFDEKRVVRKQENFLSKFWNWVTHLF